MNKQIDRLVYYKEQYVKKKLTEYTTEFKVDVHINLLVGLASSFLLKKVTYGSKV